MGNSKKIAKMYEEYLRENLNKASKQDVIEQFVQTVLGLTDFNNPEMYKNIVEILLRYEKRKALLQSGEEEEGLEDEFGEELDFTSMYKPSNFDDLLHQLKLLSKNDDLEMQDIFNATNLVKAIRPYMFDVEVPWVGTISGVLCFAWGDNVEKTAVLSFLEGMNQLEFSHKDDTELLEVEEDDMDTRDVMLVVHAAREVQSK